jgi:hypothetical protein
MSDLGKYPTTMVFAGGCAVDAAFYIYWYYDLLKNVIGGPEARRNAAFDFRRKFVALAVYTVAFGIAAYHHLWAADRGENDSTSYGRSSNNWPAYVMISGYIFEFVVFNLSFTFLYVPTLGNFKDYYVPINLEYVTHRIGEWVMLMLGMSVGYCACTVSISRFICVI